MRAFFIHTILCLFFFVGKVSGQLTEYNMSNDTTSDCKGILLDSEEGPGGLSYGNNEDYTFTIASGGVITLTFDSMFCTELGIDTLTFYNGPNTGSPRIGPAYSGVFPPPPIVANSGFLTINFKSDENVAYCGWEASWTTWVPPPPPPELIIEPAPLCNTSAMVVDLSIPVHCDSLYASSFNISGPVSPVVNSTAPLGCSSDSTTSVQLNLSQPLGENCMHYIDYTIHLFDACDSLYTYTVVDSFFMSSCTFNVDLQATQDTICPGSCTQLTAFTDECLMFNYTWSSGFPNEAGPFQVCPDVTTTYSVNVQGVDGTGPVIPASVTVYVLTPEILTSDTTVCESDDPFNFLAAPSGGTWQGEGIVNPSTGRFNPGEAGPGTFEIVYLLGGICRDTISVTVKPINAGFNEAACPGSPPFMVSGFEPPGGIWSGDSITPFGIFNPETLGVYTITYTFDGCSDSKLVYVDTLTNFTDEIDSICQSEVPFNIPADPPGGRWSGPGIVDTIAGRFDPDVAMGGLHTLHYQLHGCLDSLQLFVKAIQAGDNISACPLQDPFLIDPPAYPDGGSWMGYGIIDAETGMYDPFQAAIGDDINDTVTYWLPNGCIDTLVAYVRLTQVDQDSLFFCLNQLPVMLDDAFVGLTPRSGIWQGPGIVSADGEEYEFDPNLAGVGIHLLIYERNTCTDTLVAIVYPDELSDNDTTLCSTQDPFVILETPPGATWQGAGITDGAMGIFDPSLPPDGDHLIVYTNPAGCSDTILISTYTFVEAAITGLASDYCYADQDVVFEIQPPGGLLMGSTTDTTFNPAVEGTGWHQVSYAFGQGACYTSDAIDIYVLPELVTSAEVTEDTICKGGSAVIEIVPAGGDSSASIIYDWSHGLFPISFNTVSPDSTTTFVITTSDGCSDDVVDSVTIVVRPVFFPLFETSAKNCFGEEGFITVSVPDSGEYQYTWNTQPIQIADSISGAAGESFTVNVVNVLSGCEFDTTVKIPSHAPVAALFSVNPNFECIPYEQRQVFFIDLSSNADSGWWDFGNGLVLPYSGVNPQVDFSPGRYQVNLEIYNEGGCGDSLTKDICILDPTKIFVPDVFSPNGDNINDELFVYGTSFKSMNLMVYDRYGHLVFESNHPDQGWDGTFKGREANEGVYVYQLVVTFFDNEQIIQKGDFTLLR